MCHNEVEDNDYHQEDCATCSAAGGNPETMFLLERLTQSVVKPVDYIVCEHLNLSIAQGYLRVSQLGNIVGLLFERRHSRLGRLTRERQRDESDHHEHGEHPDESHDTSIRTTTGTLYQGVQ